MPPFEWIKISKQIKKCFSHLLIRRSKRVGCNLWSLSRWNPCDRQANSTNSVAVWGCVWQLNPVSWDSGESHTHTHATCVCPLRQLCFQKLWPLMGIWSVPRFNRGFDTVFHTSFKKSSGRWEALSEIHNHSGWVLCCSELNWKSLFNFFI